MELLLIRHARPGRLVAADATQPDPELSPIGVSQAEALGEALADEPLDAIYTSTMRRARSTAVPLARRHRLTPVADAGLIELTLGEDSYIPLDTRGPAGREQRRYLTTFSDRAATADGDRAIREFRSRVVTAVDRIAGAHPGQAVAVVCHGGVINAVLTTLLGIDELMTFNPDYTSVSRVLLSRSGHRHVASVNEHAHVLALERTAVTEARNVTH